VPVCPEFRYENFAVFVPQLPDCQLAGWLVLVELTVSNDEFEIRFCVVLVLFTVTVTGEEVNVVPDPYVIIAVSV
jgi:hypothetical protein